MVLSFFWSAQFRSKVFPNLRGAYLKGEANPFSTFCWSTSQTPSDFIRSPFVFLPLCLIKNGEPLSFPLGRISLLLSILFSSSSPASSLPQPIPRTRSARLVSLHPWPSSAAHPPGPTCARQGPGRGPRAPCAPTLGSSCSQPHSQTPPPPWGGQAPACAPALESTRRRRLMPRPRLPLYLSVRADACHVSQRGHGRRRWSPYPGTLAAPPLKLPEPPLPSPYSPWRRHPPLLHLGSPHRSRPP